MDIVEFTETVMNVELKDWQKKHLRELYAISREDTIRIVMPKNVGRHQVYIYMNQKELIPSGKTTHCE